MKKSLSAVNQNIELLETKISRGRRRRREFGFKKRFEESGEDLDTPEERSGVPALERGGDGEVVRESS